MLTTDPVQPARVWLVALPGTADAAALAPWLPTYARERPARTRAQRERLEANAALVLLTAGTAGVAPDGGAWRRSPEGAPLPPPNLPHASLSHGRGIAAVATADAPVGVDVEVWRPGRDVRAVARGALSPAEHERWTALPDAERVAAFLRLWTRKEAVLKAIGRGLAGGLRTVESGADGTIVALPAEAGDPADWTVLDLDLGDPPLRAATIAVRTPGAAVTVSAVDLPELLPTHV